MGKRTGSPALGGTLGEEESVCVCMCLHTCMWGGDGGSLMVVIVKNLCIVCLHFCISVTSIRCMGVWEYYFNRLSITYLNILVCRRIELISHGFIKHGLTGNVPKGPIFSLAGPGQCLRPRRELHVCNPNALITKLAFIPSVLPGNLALPFNGCGGIFYWNVRTMIGGGVLSLFPV